MYFIFKKWELSDSVDSVRVQFVFRDSSEKVKKKNIPKRPKKSLADQNFLKN